MMRMSIRVVPLLLTALWLAPPGNAAAPCIVPSASHPNIQAALDDTSCDPITVAPGTYTEDLFVPRSVEIIGAGTSTIIEGPTVTTVSITDGTPDAVILRTLTVTGGGSGANDGGGFEVSGAAHTLNLFDVAVTGNTDAPDGGGLALADGSTLNMTGGEISNNEVGGQGGGLRAVGGATVKLTNVHVDGNESFEGGGIFMSAGTLEINGGTIDRNTSEATGGGIRAESLASASVTGTAIRGNEAGQVGGAFLIGESIVFRNGLVEGNTAAGIGGLLLRAGSVLTVEDSVFTNNTATLANGGGLVLDDDGPQPEAVNVVNSTISGNRAGEDGGGIYVNDTSATLTNVTVTNNTADIDANGGDGGGVYSGDPGNVVRNSILSGNTDGSAGSEAPDCFGPVASGGSNIIGTVAGCTITPVASDKVGVDPMIGPLADNGGNTLTHALLPGSPAINAADASFAPPTDQRGAARNPDIGAYELVYCKKVPANDLGTDGNDTMTGGNEANGVLAFGGNDTVNTGGGNDAVCAGDGNDKVKGGGGKDQLLGEGGKDKLNGGGGKDRINGGQGRDTCNGGSGKDKGKCEKEKKI